MNTFYNTLRNEDYKPYIESKGGGSFKADYLSWAVMHDRLKSNFDYVEYKIHNYQINKGDTVLTVPYMLLPDGSAMVQVDLYVIDKNGDEHKHTECLAVRDFKMQAAKSPDAAQIENTIRRCIAKAGSMLTGFGIELWFNEDIRDLDYRPESLINGKQPTEGHITVEQNVKLERLSRDPVFAGTDTQKKVRALIDSNPTKEKAQQAIRKLELGKIKKQSKEKETK
jgi:hypothetical protein